MKTVQRKNTSTVQLQSMSNVIICINKVLQSRALVYLTVSVCIFVDLDIQVEQSKNKILLIPARKKMAQVCGI